MSAITQEDLANARQDLIAIESFVNNATGPISTRLGLIIGKSLAEIETYALSLARGPAGLDGTDGVDGIDAVIDYTLLAAKAVSIVTAPPENWTHVSTADSGTLLKTVMDAAIGSFIENDADYGHCFEFIDPGNATIGPAFPEFSHPDDVWELKTEYKVITDDTINGGQTAVRLGVTVQDGLTVTDRNKNTTAVYNNDVSDGTQQLIARFAKRVLPIVAGIDNVVLPTGGNRLYAHLTQNVAGVSNGMIRVGAIRWKNITTQIDSAGLPTGRRVILHDEKPNGTHAQVLTANVWNVRDLNTEDDPDGIVSLAANEFTPTVDCLCRWFAPGTDTFSTRLLNVTDAVIHKRGQSVQLGSTYIGASIGVAFLTAGKTYRLEQNTSFTRQAGWATSDGGEIYSIITLEA